jgi:hypothetical protein
VSQFKCFREIPLRLALGAPVRILPQETILNLRVDLVKPLLGALCLLPVCFNLGVKLCDPILGSSKLVRKPLRRVDCVSAILLGNIGSFVQKLKDRLTGFVKLSVVVSAALSGSCKWNHFGAHRCYLSCRTFRRI